MWCRVSQFQLSSRLCRLTIGAAGGGGASSGRTSGRVVSPLEVMSSMQCRLTRSIQVQVPATWHDAQHDIQYSTAQHATVAHRAALHRAAPRCTAPHRTEQKPEPKGSLREVRLSVAGASSRKRRADFQLNR